jgi:hypothetical protein
MSTHYAITEDEQELLDFTQRALGGNLPQFLLSGLGEPHHLRRQYTARSINAHWAGRTYRLGIVSEAGEGLPGDRDPLIMAALLHLLWTGEKGRDEVVFRDELVLERLGWDDTTESRLDVAAAVERYYNCAYHRTSRESLGAGKGERVSSQVQKLVTGYDTTRELREGPPKEVWKSTILYFTTKLIEEVTGTEKYFLGIDFERLHLEPVTDEIERRQPGRSPITQQSIRFQHSH